MSKVSPSNSLMVPHARVSIALFVLVLALGALSGAAQGAAVPDGSAQPPAPTRIIAPAPASATERRPPGGKLKLSTVLARQVSAGLPVWSPPPAKPTEKLPPPDPEVVKMEPFIVKDNRVKLTEADVLTDAAKLEIAEAKFLSPLYRVTFGPLNQVAGYYFNFLSILYGWHPNEAEAKTLYRQDERLKMLGELDSLARLEKIGGDAKDAKELQRIRFEASALSR